MKEIKINYIEKVIDIMKNNELTEVSLEDNEHNLYIRTNALIYANEGNSQTTAVEEVDKTAIEALIEDEKKIIPIESTMIGVFFSRPSPDSNPFVKVGDKVKAGQQICIIETIKLMNKIVSDVSGTVKEICIEDGKPVEYGQTIMYIEQD